MSTWFEYNAILKLINLIIIIIACFGSLSQQNDSQGNSKLDHKIQKRSPDIIKRLIEARKERFRKFGTTSLLRAQTRKWLEWEVKVHKKLQGKGGEEDGDDEGETTTIDVKPRKKDVVYKEKEFRALCADPVFDSVETNLDASEVLIIKGDKFFIMERLKFGSGSLVLSGPITELLPGFKPKGFMEMVTVKEGPMRGHNYAFYNDGSVMVWRPPGWLKAKQNIAFPKKKIEGLPKNGFVAALHRRDVEHPFLIGLSGKKVYYYKVVDLNFTLYNETTHDKSVERFPPDLTSATSQPNGFIYVFRGREYCVREMFYESDDKDQYCDLWRDNTRFLGCYGQYKPPYSIVNYIMKDEDDEKKDGGGDGGGDDDDDDDRSPYQIEFCEYNYIADLSQDVDGIVYIFKEDSWYYKVFSFPENVKFTGSDSSLDKWQHFHEDPDSFMIVQEGPLRGHAFEFKRDSYYHWSVDGKLLEDGIKISDIGETMERLEAIVDNSDFIEPLAVGFGQKYVHYMDLNGTGIKLIKSVEYKKTKENWPKGITAALFINPEKVYLVRKGVYCERPWECNDKKNNCCKEWLDSKIMFACDKQSDNDNPPQSKKEDSEE